MYVYIYSKSTLSYVKEKIVNIVIDDLYYFSTYGHPKACMLCTLNQNFVIYLMDELNLDRVHLSSLTKKMTASSEKIWGSPNRVSWMLTGSTCIGCCEFGVYCKHYY